MFQVLELWFGFLLLGALVGHVGLLPFKESAVTDPEVAGNTIYGLITVQEEVDGASFELGRISACFVWFMHQVLSKTRVHQTGATSTGIGGGKVKKVIRLSDFFQCK